MLVDSLKYMVILLDRFNNDWAALCVNIWKKRKLQGLFGKILTREGVGVRIFTLL